MVSRRHTSPALKGGVRKRPDAEVRGKGRWLGEVSQAKATTCIKKKCLPVNNGNNNSNSSMTFISSPLCARSWTDLKSIVSSSP